MYISNPGIKTKTWERTLGIHYLLGLHLHQDSAELRDTELLYVLQALLLIEVLPLNGSECDWLQT